MLAADDMMTAVYDYVPAGYASAASELRMRHCKVSDLGQQNTNDRSQFSSLHILRTGLGNSKVEQGVLAKGPGHNTNQKDSLNNLD